MEPNLRMRGFSSIPHECATIILCHLEYDTCALAALAQVNRAFFQLVCPLLYRDPFERLERMARILYKPAIEIAQDQLKEYKSQSSQCCDHAKATEKVLETFSLAASERVPSVTKGRTLHQVPGYLDPATVFAASPAVSWRYEALYRTLMEPILQVLNATYPSLHWPFLVHQHIRQLPLYDIPEDDAALIASAAALPCQAEDKTFEEEIVDEELFDGAPPFGSFDNGDDNDDDDSSSSGDEHTPMTTVKKRDYLQYLRVIDLAYFPTRFGGHHRHYHLHGPYQRVMLGFHSRFHSTNPTNAKIHRDYGLLYCIWDRSPKAIAFQNSLQKVYSPHSGVLDRIQRLLLARYPSKIQALRVPISRLMAFDLDPALFSAVAHRATQPTPMPFRSAFIARRMTHLSRIEIHDISQAAEDWYKLREGLAYLAAVSDPVHTIRELSIRSSAYKVCGYLIQRVLATLPKLEALEVHGVSECSCLIHAWGERKLIPRVWTPTADHQKQATPQPQSHQGPATQHQQNRRHNQQQESGLRSLIETLSNSQGAWSNGDQPVVAACECYWLSTWPVEHCVSLRVLDFETSHFPAMQWRQYSDLARFPNLEVLRLVGRDQDMFEWVLEGREVQRQQQEGWPQPNGQGKRKISAASVTKQQPVGTLDKLKSLSLMLYDEPVVGVLIDRCNTIFGAQLEEVVLVLACSSVLTTSWRFYHPFTSLRRLAIRDYTLETFDFSCLVEACPQLELLALRYTVVRETLPQDYDEYLEVRQVGTEADIVKADRHVERDVVPSLKRLTRLRSLWLEGTWFMTPKAISAIVSELTQLSVLGLQACPNIKMSSVELKKLVADLRADKGSQTPSTKQVNGTSNSNGINANHCRRLELRWINTDLPDTHTWFWQDTKILYYSE